MRAPAPDRARPLLVPVLVVLLAAAGCSAGEPTPEPTPVPTVTQTDGPSVEPTATEAPDVAAIEDVFGRYVDAIVTMENGPTVDPALLYDVAAEQVTTDEIQRVLRYQEMGIRRVGAPEVGEPVVTVDGDTARLEVCFDEDDWTAESEAGQAIVEEPFGPLPRVFELTRGDGGWLVSAVVVDDPATITC